LFDNLILLKSGRVVYQGKGSDALMHFAILGILHLKTRVLFETFIAK
jgi:hypothetical protein